MPRFEDLSDPAVLRSMGSFAEVTREIEGALHLRLGVRGWQSLFDKLQATRDAVVIHRDALHAACEQPALDASRRTVEVLLGVRFANTAAWSDIVGRLISSFGQAAFDPYAHYERTKQQKFRASSRLDGIELGEVDDQASLDDVLDKYRR